MYTICDLSGIKKTKQLKTSQNHIYIYIYVSFGAQYKYKALGKETLIQVICVGNTIYNESLEKCILDLKKIVCKVQVEQARFLFTWSKREPADV